MMKIVYAVQLIEKIRRRSLAFLEFLLGHMTKHELKIHEGDLILFKLSHHTTTQHVPLRRRLSPNHRLWWLSWYHYHDYLRVHPSKLCLQPFHVLLWSSLWSLHALHSSHGYVRLYRASWPSLSHKLPIFGPKIKSTEFFFILSKNAKNIKYEIVN